jgi:hypothetical protein
MLPRPLQESNVVGKGGTAGFLGKGYDPYTLFPDGDDLDMSKMERIKVEDLKLRPEVFAFRLQRRAKLREAVNATMPDIEEAVSDYKLDDYYDRALNLIASGRARESFELDRESKDVRDLYGRNTFGQSCLLARRLVEAGCSFIEIGMGGWDMHADVAGNCKRSLPSLDAGMGTLIKDLAEKDLLKETLVIWCGEFGRTPSINAGKGRDHHADGFSVVMAGGGFAGGRVYGDTGPNGDQCQKPVPIWNLFASIYKACGIDGNKKYDTEGRKIKYVSQNGSVSTSGTPIAELF